VTTFFAGDIPSAEDFTRAAKIGEMVADVTATSDSSTWNSATKVLTNLVAAFTASASGIKYSVLAQLTFSCASASNTTALGLVWKQGTVAATDTLFGACGPRTHPDATGFNTTVVHGTFTTLAAGAHEVAVIGWMPTGNTGVTKLEGDAAFAINRLTVVSVS
jgi:hypothetical protein